MISHHDPEREVLRELGLRRLDRLWRDHQILDNTYLRSLFISGLLPDEANSRLNVLKRNKA